MQKIAAAILFLFLFTTAVSQPVNYAVLSKAGKKKRYMFFEGQEISLKLRGDIAFKTDVIHTINDTALEFADYSVLYDSIDKIKITKRNYFLIPDSKLLTYAILINASFLIYKAAYAINGATIDKNDFWRQVFYLNLPVPFFYLTNVFYRAFTKTEYEISPGNYRLRPVVFRR